MSVPRKRVAREMRAAWPRSARARIGFWLTVSALLIRGTVGLGRGASIERSACYGQAIAGEHGSAESRAGMEIVQHGGYPELRVDGKPFFIHSAAFFYYRTPRDLWLPMLESYRRLGINTLDIYIPWNWHEPTEGEFDFDGHTNPRRDLRRLLGLTSDKGFRLIARPGPEILNEWRYGGYPGWLLDQPAYKMDPLDWVEGRYAPLDNLNARNAEAAASGWLDNATHLEQTRLWMSRVAKELAPYSSHALMHAKLDSRDGRPHEMSGPLLFVQLGDDFAIGRTNSVGPDFWRYVEELRAMLAGGGLDAPVFINPTDMRVTAEGSRQDPPVGVMGQWYMQPDHPSSGDTERPVLTARDANEIEYFAEELKTQPEFPPVMIEYQAGWYTPGDDDRPRPNRPENTLLSSRLLIANGIHGFNYFPLQDTYTPAGFSVPWANRSYRWDAALSPEGDPQPRIEAVRRNGALLEAWGPLLAASHKRADFGIIDPLGAYDQSGLRPKDVIEVSQALMRIERLGDLTALSSELLDPEFQPVEQLLRDPVVILPVFDPALPQFQLSARAEQRMVDYVERGGTLVVFPARPAGKVLSELWSKGTAEPVGSSSPAIRAKWRFGAGQALESGQDFYSWISLDRSLAQNREQKDFGSASDVLDQFMSAAGVKPAVVVSKRGEGADELIVSEIVTNEGTETLGNRKSGQGFLSVTNLSTHSAADAALKILRPSASARASQNEYSSIDVVVPAHDSLLLPLDIPLCAQEAADCPGAIPSAGAEFLLESGEGKTLELTFYVPSRADIHLELPEKPSHLLLDDADTHPTSSWVASDRELQVTMPRGAAPGFERTLKLDLPHGRPFPKAKSNPSGKAPPEDLDCYVANAIRFPTGGNAFLRTYPALIVPDADQKLNVLLMAENRNESSSGYITLAFDKPLHGTKTLVVPPRGNASELIEFHPADLDRGVPPAPDHLFHAAIEVHIGRDRRIVPIVFLLHANESEDAYRFDFDRDGFDEWVLENDRLRLIVSPESGGRAVALMDKGSALSLSTSVGLLQDGFSFTKNPPGLSEARRRGRYGLANRPYVAEWSGDRTNPVLSLRYLAPDVFPAGASIQKAVRFEDAKTIAVDYKIGLEAKRSGEPASAEPQSFVAMNSLPAEEGDSTATRFCWSREREGRAAQTSGKRSEQASRDAESGDETCKEFRREGLPIVVPEGVDAVEIHSTDRPDIEIRWDCAEKCAQLTILPKYFSALFRLEFPPLSPGAEASYRMHLRLTSGS